MCLAHHELESVTIIIITGLPEQPSMCPAYDGKISRACTEYISHKTAGKIVCMQCCNQNKVGAHLHAFGMHGLVNAMLCKGMNAHGTSSSSRAPQACPALVLMSARDH